MKNRSILKIIELAQTDNQKAFSVLFDNYWNPLFNFQLKKTKNEEKAEDITIRTFAKAFDKIKTYNSEYEFKTWLFTISKNIQIDDLRKKKKNKTIELSNNNINSTIEIIDSDLSPEEKLITNQNISQLISKIKTLKKDYKRILILRYFEELSYKEISHKMKQPINTIKVKILRARKILGNKILHEN